MILVFLKTTQIHLILNLKADDHVPIKLTVYDILGKKITTLVKETQNPGNYKVEWDAKNQASGIYIYKLDAGSYVATKKMNLLQ